MRARGEEPLGVHQFATSRSLAVRSALALVAGSVWLACSSDPTAGGKSKDATSTADTPPLAFDTGGTPLDTASPPDAAPLDVAADDIAPAELADLPEPADPGAPLDTAPDTAEVIVPVDVPKDSGPPTGKLALEVDGKAVPVVDAALSLPAIVPGPGVVSVATLVVRNAGSVPFTVVGVELLAKNVDGTLKNPLVSLGSDGKPIPTLPVDLLPVAQVPTAKLALPLSFAPTSIEDAVSAGGTDATLRLTLSNADVAEVNVRIVVPQFVPDVALSPLSLLFTKATLAVGETQKLTIENQGNAPLYLLSAALDPPSPRFTIAPISASKLGPKGTGDAQIDLEVTYKPDFASAKDKTVLVLTTDDPDEPVLKVPLSSTFEAKAGQSPCVVSYPGQDQGALDFTDAQVGAPKLLTVQIDNVGLGVCTLNGLSVPEDPTGTAFYVAAYSQAPGGEPQPIAQFPLGIGTGYKVLIDVTYTVLATAKSATLTIDVSDPLPKLVKVPMIGGGPKPCFALGPGSKEAPEVLEFAGNAGDVVKRHIALFDCGEAPLTLGPVKVVDPGGTQPIFIVPKLPEEIPANGVVWLEITGIFESGATDALGSITIPYSLDTGPAEAKVTLRRRVLGVAKLPTANPGDESKYGALLAGQPFTLDATASTGGTLPLAASGYLWTLAVKPTSSTLVVAGPPGPPLLAVTPDVPGAYMFALVVKSAGTLPWYSPEQTVTVTVK